MGHIEFNNGFVTAICLFLEHKDNWQKFTYKEGGPTVDLRLYSAIDHIYDIEIPKKLSPKLKKRINRWISRCFHNRMKNFSDSKIPDALFREAENILKVIDEEVFKTKTVLIRQR